MYTSPMAQFFNKKGLFYWQKITRYLISLNSFPAVLVACFTSFSLLGSKSFWIDEPFSYYAAHSTHILFPMIWNQEINMWLYYFLLHFWIMFNHSALFIRSFSAIFAIASVAIFYHIGKLVFNKPTASMASILLAINMFFVFYAQD